MGVAGFGCRGRLMRSAILLSDSLSHGAVGVSVSFGIGGSLADERLVATTRGPTK
jgi:hypothetical protein